MLAAKQARPYGEIRRWNAKPFTFDRKCERYVLAKALKTKQPKIQTNGKAASP